MATLDTTSLRPARGGATSPSLSGIVVGFATIACVTLAAVVAVLAVYYSSQTSHNRARAHLATPYLDRLYLEPFRLVGDPRVIEDARLWMPEEATYRVVTGPNVRLRKPATLESAIALVRFHLMPRRLVAGPAGWVLCYGCRRSLLGDRFQVLSDGGNGVVFGRMR